MGFVFGSESMPNSISYSGGIMGRSLRKTSINSLTTGTDSMGELGSLDLGLLLFVNTTFLYYFT